MNMNILPGDKAYQPHCSRCRGPVGAKVLVLEWNKVEFWYCSECVAKAEAEAAKAKK